MDPGGQVPGTEVVCLLPLPLLCDEPSGGPQPGESPQDSWSSAPQHEESWSEPPTREGSRPGTRESEPPWRPAGEEEHRVPKGHPETGGGALAASGGPVWPFALGGAALLAGAGLAGFAARRTSRPAPPE
ncbi:hypothetical protein [Nonomuraea maheshkhaliensis]|uniref:hypothetical protein n=1 Tax=Nonomuraea maheshkhaliensis TaxID=419590 RepID=UPI0031F89212